MPAKKIKPETRPPAPCCLLPLFLTAHSVHGGALSGLESSPIATVVTTPNVLLSDSELFNPTRSPDPGSILIRHGGDRAN